MHISNELNFCYPMLIGSAGESSLHAVDHNYQIIDHSPLETPQPKRKRPKTQGEMRLDVQELHVEVLQLEKEKAEIEKENLLLQQQKLKLQIHLLERKANAAENNEPFQCPLSPIY